MQTVSNSLLFADESLLFTRVNGSETDKFMQIPNRYQISLGQMVNLDKSEAFFSRNMREEVKDMIQNRMKVRTVQSHSKYLGLPVLFGRSKKEVFKIVVEHVWKKLRDGRKDSYLDLVKKS